MLCIVCLSSSLYSAVSFVLSSPSLIHYSVGAGVGTAKRESSFQGEALIHFLVDQEKKDSPFILVCFFICGCVFLFTDFYLFLSLLSTHANKHSLNVWISYTLNQTFFCLSFCLFYSFSEWIRESDDVYWICMFGEFVPYLTISASNNIYPFFSHVPTRGVSFRSEPFLPNSSTPLNLDSIPV